MALQLQDAYERVNIHLLSGSRAWPRLTLAHGQNHFQFPTAHKAQAGRTPDLGPQPRVRSGLEPPCLAKPLATGLSPQWKDRRRPALPLHWTPRNKQLLGAMGSGSGQPHSCGYVLGTLELGEQGEDPRASFRAAGEFLITIRRGTSGPHCPGTSVRLWAPPAPSTTQVLRFTASLTSPTLPMGDPLVCKSRSWRWDAPPQMPKINNPVLKTEK